MSKRIFAILCTVAMLVLVGSTAFAATGDLVWELTPDIIDGLISDGNSFDYLMNSGDGTANAVNEGGLRFKASRPNDYSVVDLKIQDIAEAGVTYTIVVEYKSKVDCSFRLVETSGYADLVTPVEGTSGTLTYTFKDPTTRFRFQTAGTEDFTVVSAVLWEGDKAGTPPAAAAATDNKAATTNAKTGDNFIVYVALGVLALAACGAFVLSRKAKAE